MKSTFCLAITTALALAPLAVSAQTVCSEIIRSANYNQYQSLNQTQQHSLNKANLCLQEYDRASKEQQAQIEASYEVFTGGAKGSSSEIKERQRQECQSKYGEYWFSQLGLSSQKIVSDKAMDTVAKCIDAYAKGLRVEPTFSESEAALTVSLTWTRSTALPFKQIIRTPEQSISCKIDGKDTSDPSAFQGRTIAPGSSTTFVCNRIKAEQIISGETVECLSDGLIAIDVLESPITISLFRRCSSDFLRSRARDVEAQVNALRGELTAIKQQTTSLSDALQRTQLECTRTVILGKEASCPPGYVVTGCSAGANKGSIDLDTSCKTHDDNPGWTQARCCRIAK